MKLDHIVLLSKQTGTPWRVWIKKGYYLNLKADHVTNLILKEKQRSWWQSIKNIIDCDFTNSKLR